MTRRLPRINDRGINWGSLIMSVARHIQAASTGNTLAAVCRHDPHDFVTLMHIARYLASDWRR